MSITKSLSGAYEESLSGAYEESLSGAYEESQNQPAKDKHGRVISYEKENISIWKENVQSILNRPEPATTADIQ